MPPRNSRADDLTVTQSVLDRLIDRDPNLASDPSTTRAQSVRQLKLSLRRDLEWLLNTRRIVDSNVETMEELERSLYNYGLPDFGRVNVALPKDRNSLARELENTIGQFEPRLKEIRVRVEEDPEAPKSRILHLQIEALLMMDPAPEQVSFDTVLQLSSGEYQIRGDPGA
jgi:type VI secretion system protein ImpF